MAEIDWASLYTEATTVLEGDFPVVIAKSEASTTSTGKPCIKTKLVIESGPYVGREINHMFTITADNPMSMQIFFRQMKTLGLGEAFFAARPSMEAIADALADKRAVVTLVAREWNEVTRENVNAWKPATGLPVGGFATPATASSPARGLSDMSSATLPTTPAPTASEMPADPF